MTITWSEVISMVAGAVRVSVFYGLWNDPNQPSCVRFDVSGRVHLTKQPLTAAHRLNGCWEDQLGAHPDKALGERGAALRDWIRKEELITGFLLDRSRLVLLLPPVRVAGQEAAEKQIALDVEELLLSAKAVFESEPIRLRLGGVEYTLVANDLFAPAGRA